MNRISLRTLIVITAAICMIVVSGLLIVLCVTDPNNTPPPYESENTGTRGTDPVTDPPATQGVTEPETEPQTSPVTDAPGTDPVTLPPETQGETNPPETVPVASADYPNAVPLSAARDPQWLEEALIIGDSRTVGVGPTLKMMWYAQQSLNISTAFTNKFINIDDPDNLNTIIEACQKKPIYHSIYFWFGLNDVGNDVSYFVNKYNALISEIKSYMPNADFYIISILPVTQARSDKNLYGVTNTNIKKFNDEIYKMCESYGYHFLYLNEVFIAEDKTLSSEYAAGDGTHLNSDAALVMKQYILEHTIR